MSSSKATATNKATARVAARSRRASNGANNGANHPPQSAASRDSQGARHSRGAQVSGSARRGLTTATAPKTLITNAPSQTQARAATVATAASSPAKPSKSNKKLDGSFDDTAKLLANCNEMSATNFALLNDDSIKSDIIVEQETDVDEDTSKLLSCDEGGASGASSDSVSDTLADNGPILASLIESPRKDLTCESAATTSAPADSNHATLPAGWQQHHDQNGAYYWHLATGLIQRQRPSTGDVRQIVGARKSSVVLCHDDEEINQESRRTSLDEDELDESGAALTVDELGGPSGESAFVVYGLGCCEVDETQLVASKSTRAIQKCILRLSNQAASSETACWGLEQSEPILMKLLEDHIQFTHIKTQTLLRSQPIQTIKTWAVDDDNNFAFIVEGKTGANQTINCDYSDSIDLALLNQPTLMCYVFSSMDDDDDMSCKVAAKLNDQITRQRERMSTMVSKSTRIQQMVASEQSDAARDTDAPAASQADDMDNLEASSETTINVKYIGKTQVPRPVGIDVLNVAIDKCLTEASEHSRAPTSDESALLADGGGEERAAGDLHVGHIAASLDGLFAEPASSSPVSPLIDAKLHVSPSSIIVENECTGEIIVECRIRYLTFMGISRRDIRWCAFIMQNTTTKTFEAHCLECAPTAGHVCEAIQLSCAKMYEKVVKNSRVRSREPEAMSIIPSSSKIRSTLNKTLSRIKLRPVT